MDSKKKFTRTFSRKVRTGCLTCKVRRKKCDEEKPTCRRCRSDVFKCDGYAKNHDSQESSQALMVPTNTGFTIPDFFMSDIRYNSPTEKNFVHYFRQWTSSCPPGSALLWKEFVLPLAHQDEMIKQVVAAVGAAYHYFLVNRSSDSSKDLGEMETMTIRHYNKAISHILRRTSSDEPEDLLMTVLSCLLFVCFEGMMGRRDELLKHLKAGLRMLESSEDWKTIKDGSLARVVIDLFGHAGVDITMYLEEDLFDASQYQKIMPTLGQGDRPFVDLQQAFSVLKTIDMELIVTCGVEGPGCGPEFSLDQRILNKFYLWNRQFELTVAGLDVEAFDRSAMIQLKILRLEQKLWLIMTEYSSHTYHLVWGILWSSYLDEAEEVARMLMVGDSPAFSLDGVLVSGLSFAFVVAEDITIKNRALSLLRTLNRREGIWDSNEMFEIHSADLATGEYPKPLPYAVARHSPPDHSRMSGLIYDCPSDSDSEMVNGYLGG
ncbi:unnamed protein product [Periconia digitata]|uniref:Zn(2)-C6 fungal-type domain-containing protein n=1 Tax=Periconia digitata TaxID=1303443 RepID=A0A9W4XSZ0_9PLEO|nr:unnamed protein product [Periconia digitata]